MDIVQKRRSIINNLKAYPCSITHGLSRLFILAFITIQLAMNAYGSTNSPNILFIYTDDQSTRTVSCYPDAYNYANTPNIDALADEGIRFDQAYIGAKCVPARATALTGRLQYDTRRDTDNNIQSNHWLPDLRENGYYTGMIGKWHWGAGAAAHGHGINWDWSVVWDHATYDAAGGYYYEQYVMIDGEPQVPLEGYTPDGYSTDEYTERTKEFIQNRANATDGKPWFFWLCYAGVHGPREYEVRGSTYSQRMASPAEGCLQ